MTGTIFLIVEDQTDADVVRALLKAKDVDVKITPLLPSGGSGGLSRLVKDLENLIRTAIARRISGDCIAVLHDADLNIEPNRNLYDKIKEICDRYNNDVVLVLAKDEIESWMLADEGLCNWLEITAKNCDSETRPSDRLQSLVKAKTGKRYSGRIRDQVLKKLDASGDKHSPSMREAVKHLENAKCVR